MGLFFDTERFHRNVELIPFSECHYWTGFADWRGYGRFFVSGRSWLAHRVAYALANGGIDPALEVLHSCDNPSCVNPAHLRLGTHAENMADKMARNRQPSGTASTSAKLTEDEVKSLCRDIIAGVGYGVLRDRYGISPASLSDIKHRRSYREITSEALADLPMARHGNKIDNATVLAIHAACAAGETNAEVARRFGVSFHSVADIKLGRTHRQLTGGRVS